VRAKRYATLFVTLNIMLMSVLANAESLYSQKEYQSLVSDKRSIKPGDILTVLIYESATASSSNNVDLSKSSDIGVSAGDGTNTIGASVGVNNDFKGGGSKNRSEKLMASVAVTVLGKTSNGGIKVKGEQTIEYNEEKQKISVEGDLRPEDITADNTVLSSRIANAVIKVDGEGLLTNHSKPGVLTRFFNWLF